MVGSFPLTYNKWTIVIVSVVVGGSKFNNVIFPRFWDIIKHAMLAYQVSNEVDDRNIPFQILEYLAVEHAELHEQSTKEYLRTREGHANGYWRWALTYLR